jgi:hypothetical protein
LAKEVAKRGIADLGEDVWEKHIKTVEGFWRSISRYFDSIDVSGIKIFQDGMMAEGVVGLKIVEAGIKSGSKNYDIVLRLIRRGGILVKTEDLRLIKEERERLLAIIQTKSIIKKLLAFIKYKLVKNRLLNKRDKFIAKRINETLNQGERGLIFIGAYHNINKRLPSDIQIREIKDTQKIRKYQMMLPFYNKNKEKFEELGRYLVSEINDVTSI